MLIALEACDKAKQDPSMTSDAGTTAAEIDGAAALLGDGGVAPKEAERRLVMKLAAASFVASVSDMPDWPENDAGARRLGYLRNGAVVNAYDPPLKNDECKDGWYELVEGGYVCGKSATIDLTNPRVKLAPKQPDLDAGMPYRYGVNVADGTPVYRRVLNAEDRRKYESHLSAKTEDKDKDNAKESPSGEVSTTEAKEKDEEPPLATAEEEPPPPRRNSRTREREKDREKERNRDPFRSDAGRPMLKELKGRGVLVRRMARGFTVALDRDFKAASTRWWRTTFGFAIPYDRIVVQGGLAKHVGNWFNGENAVVDMLPFPELEISDASPPVPSIPLDAGAPLAGVVGFAM